MKITELRRAASVRLSEKVRRWPRWRLSKLWQESLVNRYFAIAQSRQLLLIVVDQDDIVSEIGKTRARHQPNVSRTHHRNLHRL